MWVSEGLLQARFVWEMAGPQAQSDGSLCLWGIVSGSFTVSVGVGDAPWLRVLSLRRVFPVLNMFITFCWSQYPVQAAYLFSKFLDPDTSWAVKANKTSS